MEPNITSFSNPVPSQAPRTPGVFQGSPEVSTRTPAASSVRTMKSDISEAIKKQNETYVSIALAEERKRKAELEAQAVVAVQKTPVETAVPRRRGRIFIVLGVFFVVVAGGLAINFFAPLARKITIPAISLPSFGGYNELSTTTLPTEQVAAPVILAPSLIPAQSEKQFNISQETPELIFAKIAVEYASGVESGSIKNLYFNEEVARETGGGAGPAGATTAVAVSAGGFLALTGVRIPDVFARVLESDFMAGILGEATRSTPFFILNVSSREGGLAGMLAWEKDLPRFFDTVFGTKIIGGTPGGRLIFRDTIILGRDVRTLETASGQNIVYAFADTDTIVIAGSSGALNELLTKMGATGR